MISNLLKKLIKIRRTIHQHPELGNAEFKTAAFIEKTLKNLRIKTKRLSKTGVVGILEGTKKPANAKVIALRADMDALPIQEKTNKSFASKRKGIMHACGHDANTTMVLGAAMHLAKERKNISGTVKFIFQPNEESSGGAKDMIKAGALKNPRPDAIVGIHVNPWIRTGALGLKRGAMMAAVDKFTIEVIGEGGHGAYPELAINAVSIISKVISGLDEIIAKDLRLKESAVISIGAVKGGERFNIISGAATAVGTVRTLSEKVRKLIREKIEKKTRKIVSSYGAKCKILYEELGNPLINSPKVLELCRKAGERSLGGKNIVWVKKPSMGGEDFAEYLAFVPGCFIYMGTKKNKSYPWHHERFDIDETAMPKGSAVLSAIAKDFLN